MIQYKTRKPAGYAVKNEAMRSIRGYGDIRCNACISI